MSRVRFPREAGCSHCRAVTQPKMTRDTAQGSFSCSLRFCVVPRRPLSARETGLLHELVMRSCASFVGSAKPTVDCWFSGFNSRGGGRDQSRIQTRLWPVVVLHSIGGGWVFVSPPCGRGGSRVVVMLHCFSRSCSGRCSSAGCGGAVALEGRGVYLHWAETLCCDPTEGCSSTGGAEKMWAWRTDGSWLREKWKDIHD